MAKAIGDTCLLIASVCSMIGYLPQIVKMLRTKKAEDISVASWVLYVVSTTSYLVYAYTAGGFMLLVSTWLDFALNLATLVLTLVYRRRK